MEYYGNLVGISQESSFSQFLLAILGSKPSPQSSIRALAAAKQAIPLVTAIGAHSPEVVGPESSASSKLEKKNLEELKGRGEF
jgi:hypothetical protein